MNRKNILLYSFYTGVNLYLIVGSIFFKALIFFFVLDNYKYYYYTNDKSFGVVVFLCFGWFFSAFGIINSYKVSNKLENLKQQED